ncbi:MAG: four helix bundle protein [Bacteroidales bacterium]
MKWRRISNKFQGNKMTNSKPVYNLEERTFQFAKQVRLFKKKLPKNTANIEDSKQLVKSSGSVGANYIEANESLSKKDFIMRVKICRKEAKESAYFLRLIYETNAAEFEKEGIDLHDEAIQLKKIFSSIIEKSV